MGNIEILLVFHYKKKKKRMKDRHA